MRCKNRPDFLEQTILRIPIDSLTFVCWSNSRSVSNCWVATSFELRACGYLYSPWVRVKSFTFPQIAFAVQTFEFSAVDQIEPSSPILPHPNLQLFGEMAGAASQWAESEMDVAKIQALVDSEKIPKAEFVRWIEAARQH